MNKKQLAKKLSNHRFTIVDQGDGSNDPDVIEFKAKQKQAMARAERRKERKFKTTLACKLQGIQVQKAS